MFLYWTVSTLNPIVGIVVTTSPICRRYRIVVLPLFQHECYVSCSPPHAHAQRERERATHAESSPSMSIRTSLLREKRPESLEKRVENETPMAGREEGLGGGGSRSRRAVGWGVS